MSYDPITKEPTLFLSTLVDDFGCFRESPASIKHAKTGQYIVCNGTLAKRDGIPMEEYIGLTSEKVQKIMGWKPSVTKNAVDIDKKISAQEIPGARYNQVLLAHDKSIVIEEVFKKPVLGDNKKVAAILAYAHDITHHAHPLYLFSVYNSYYPSQEAIQRFLHYKELDTVFEASPSYEELLTLLTMRDTTDTDAIAEKLHYSASDIETYQAKLSEKLNVVELDDVLTRLRWHNESAWEDAVR